MTTTDKIKATLAAVGEPFNYGYIEQMNDILYNEDMPTVFVLPPVNLTMLNQWQRYRFGLTVFFVNGSDCENTEADKEDIIDVCRKRAAAWLYELSHGNIFDVIGEPVLARVDFELNALVVGVRVTVTLQTHPENYCTQP